MTLTWAGVCCSYPPSHRDDTHDGSQATGDDTHDGPQATGMIHMMAPKPEGMIHIDHQQERMLCSLYIYTQSSRRSLRPLRYTTPSVKQHDHCDALRPLRCTASTVMHLAHCDALHPQSRHSTPVSSVSQMDR